MARWVGWLPCVVLVVVPGCDAQNGVSMPDGGGDVARPVDLMPPDLAPDVGPDGGCVPGCHWDCLGGTVCAAGEVYVTGGGSVPCCKFGDPWPFPGPECTAGPPVWTCATPQCAAPDPRYALCSRVQAPPGDYNHLYRLNCTDTKSATPGAACATDTDCRPAAPDVEGRLVCEAATLSCVETSRPDQPASYQASCGLSAADFGSLPGWDDRLVPGKTCPLCHVFWDKANACLLQGCTMPCKFDEDCPPDSICLCAMDESSMLLQFCAEATGRELVEDRVSGLSCPGGGGVDAGPPDGSP